MLNIYYITIDAYFSAGIFVCGPCPVAAIQQRCFGAPYDAPFIYASVDADVVRLIVRDGLVVERMLDTESVGQLIYTKSIGSDNPDNLTQAYKSKKSKTRPSFCDTFNKERFTKIKQDTVVVYVLLKAANLCYDQHDAM